MYKFLTKNGTALAFGLGVIVSVLGFAVILSGLEGYNMLAEEDQGTTSIFNVALWGAIVLVIVCFAAMLIFGLVHVVNNWKEALEGVIALAVIIGLTVLFYSMSEVETSGKIAGMISKGELDGNTSKWISGALGTTLVMLAITVVVFVFSEIRNAFK